MGAPSDHGGTALAGGLGFRARRYIAQPTIATKRSRISPTRRMSDVPVSPELA
jgi:hypothetical protein